MLHHYLCYRLHTNYVLYISYSSLIFAVSAITARPRGVETEVNPSIDLSGWPRTSVKYFVCLALDHSRENLKM